MSTSQLFNQKVSEGGFNRVLELGFPNGMGVIARLPYRFNGDFGGREYTVASEAATMDFLRGHGVPVRKVLGYCTSDENEVGVEYIVMDKLDGVRMGMCGIPWTMSRGHISLNRL